MTRTLLPCRLRLRMALLVVASAAVTALAPGVAQADFTNSCGTGCVDFGGETASGGFTYARRSDGNRMAADWDSISRNQAFRGCIAFQYVSNGGIRPDPWLCGYNVGTCWTYACQGQTTASLWVFHRNGDNNSHNLVARATSY